MWRALVFVIAACACKASKKDAGEVCKYSFDCESRICFGNICQTGEIGGKCNATYECREGGKTGVSCYRAECRAAAGTGGKCDAQEDCATGNTCIERVCLDPAGVKRHEAALAEAARKAQAEKEARMLAESGVSNAAPAAEVGAYPPGPGTRVRTAKVTAPDSAFAACKADERLIGGGCQSEQPVTGNYPSGQGTEDTVGARWNCTGAGVKDVTAYALCAKVSP